MSLENLLSRMWSLGETPLLRRRLWRRFQTDVIVVNFWFVSGVVSIRLAS